MELTMYNVARINSLEVVVMQYFQIEHASVESRNIRRSLDVIRIAA